MNKYSTYVFGKDDFSIDLKDVQVCTNPKVALGWVFKFKIPLDKIHVCTEEEWQAPKESIGQTLSTTRDVLVDALGAIKTLTSKLRIADTPPTAATPAPTAIEDLAVNIQNLAYQIAEEVRYQHSILG